MELRGSTIIVRGFDFTVLIATIADRALGSYVIVNAREHTFSSFKV